MKRDSVYLELTAERIARCAELRADSQRYADDTGRVVFFTHNGKVFDCFQPRMVAE